MTIRSKQWHTKTSRLPNSFVNVSMETFHTEKERIGGPEND